MKGMLKIVPLVAVLLSLGMAVPATAAPVNVNKASAEEIDAALKGIGLKTARAIVTFREQQGPFKSVEQLGDVKGVGAKTIEKNRANIKLQ
ncbi:MAG: ComEA family DNA-binding protein [Pseudomonadota bacterium]